MLLNIGSLGAIPRQLGKKPLLDSVVPSVCCELDATIPASYPGTGQVWANLVKNPADGIVQGGYDHTLGLDDNAASDPTFVGISGDPGAYWSFTSGQRFIIRNGNTPLLRDLHKSTVLTDFWTAVIWYNPASVTAGQMVFIGNATSNAQHGFNFRVEIGNTRYSFRQHNGSAQATTFLTGGMNKLDAWNYVIFSFSQSVGQARFWRNSKDQQTVALGAFGVTSSAPSATTQLSGVASGSTLTSGQRMAHLSFGNAFLNDVETEAVIDLLVARHAGRF
ncbi:MAG: hypothetical protein HY370_02325 [Proteobacteria bacterium]|nr:hypothetical protein [Pseudomonadota bacterium]